MNPGGNSLGDNRCGLQLWGHSEIQVKARSSALDALEFVACTATQWSRLLRSRHPASPGPFEPTPWVLAAPGAGRWRCTSTGATPTWAQRRRCHNSKPAACASVLERALSRRDFGTASRPWRTSTVVVATRSAASAELEIGAAAREQDDRVVGNLDLSTEFFNELGNLAVQPLADVRWLDSVV